MSGIAINDKSNKSLKKKWVIIVVLVLSVVLVAAGVIGVSYLIPADISGTWELVVNPELAMSTVDEVPESERAYYVFDKPDRYGRGEYSTCYQGGVEYFGYQLMEENGVKKINLGSEDMEYKITGSKLIGKAKLTIVFPAYTDESTGASYEAQEYIFEQAKNPQYEKQSYKEFETDSALTGEKWTSNERTLSYYYYEIPYTQTVEFSDKGVMTIRYESEDLMLDRYMYYAYTANDKELVFSLVTDMDTKYTIGYEFDTNGNLRFVNDTTASSMFADAFFGDYTFYTNENLPEPTVGLTD